MGSKKTFAFCLAALLAGSPGWALAGVPCSVPGAFPTLAAALADTNCGTIALDPGRYVGQIISRSVTIIGADPATTVIEGTATTPAVLIIGAGVLVGLQNLHLESGNGPEPVLQTLNGGELAFATNIQVGVGEGLFRNGFEGN